MRTALQQILEKYPSARANTPFKGPHEISDLFNKLRKEVADLPSVKSNKNLIVKSSYGKGNWATVPWLAILDTRETSTTQDGTYVVFLFQEEGKGCHLKLAQGVTELEKAMKSKAVDELKKRADEVRERYVTEDTKEFDVSGGAKLESKGKLANLYEASTIYSKFYEVAAIPEDEALAKDINHLLEVYGQYVHDRIQVKQELDSITPTDHRIWALSAGENGSLWEEQVQKGEIAIGWDQLGDLSRFTSQMEVLSELSRVFGGDTTPTNDARCCYEFVHEMSVGDIIVAKVGRKKILGMGVVTSDYFWDENASSFKNRRKVRWEKKDPAEFPGGGTTVKTLTEITPYPSFVSLVYEYLGYEQQGIIDVEETEEQLNEYLPSTIVDEGCFISEDKLLELMDRLRVKKNIILQGPPGTGKTWLAKRLGYAVIGQKIPSRIRVVQFHANLSYEDFVRGYRPSGEGKLALVDGAFMQAIEDARNTSQPVVFVIEEINRGNPAQVFGEMLTLLEADKRGPQDAMELTYKRSDTERVHIPPNLYVIGTMNIADRSLALVDLALRRRFAFIDLEPVFNTAWREWLINRCSFPPNLVATIETKMTRLNNDISEDSRLGSQFRVGHSYVTPSPDSDIKDPREWFRQVIQTEISPLLSEYWFDDAECADKQVQELLREI